MKKMRMVDIRPTPRFCAMLYAAIEHDQGKTWTCDRTTGRITMVGEIGPSLERVFARFVDKHQAEVAAIERDVPEHWPDDEISLGFVCPPPGQLIPALRGEEAYESISA